MDEIGLTELWKILKHKFCIDLKNDFSNKNVEAWINHFVPNKAINVYQFGKAETGKKANSKTIKIYTGNLFSSLIKGRIPAKLMAKIVFKKLTNQNFHHSEIELLGIQKNKKDENQTIAHIRFERFNIYGKMFEAGVGIYGLTKIKEKWYINEMSIYDDNDEAISKVNLSEMWHP